jgi:hypothetical protein
VSSSNTEDSSFVSDHCPSELGDVEIDVEGDFEGSHLLYFVEVDMLCAPLKVMYIL